MGRIVEQLRAVGARRAALFVVLTTAVAVSFYFGVREAGVGPRTEAGVEATVERSVEPTQQNNGEEAATEPLTLTLSAPEICETTQPQGYSGASVRWDDTKEDWVVEYHSDDWFGVGETPVAWRASGGAPPYTLVIDGETRDADQTYEGPSGTASVSCAMQFDETLFDEDGRGYRTEPEVDSGLKTIRATVTDAAEATAEASVDVYVILELPGSDSILKRDKTYRVFGQLITAPASHDVQVGSVVEADCPDPATSTTRCGPAFSLRLVDANARISLFMTGDPEELREYATNGVWGAAAIEDELIEAAFDALIDSLNRRPSVERAGP